MASRIFYFFCLFKLYKLQSVKEEKINTEEAEIVKHK